MEDKKDGEHHQPFEKFLAMTVGQKLRYMRSVLNGEKKSCLQPCFMFRKLSHDPSLGRTERELAGRAATFLHGEKEHPDDRRERQVRTILAIASLHQTIDQEQAFKNLP